MNQAKIITLYRDPSSVYVVYHSPQIFDRCRQWEDGVYGPPITMSYQSASLSTLEYRHNAPPATKSFDFADLPCSPSSVADAYSPGTPYFPVLVSPFSIRYGLMVNGDGLALANQQCNVAAVRDPPVKGVRVGKITGPKEGGNSIP